MAELELTAAVVLHAASGVLLAAVVWLVGAGWLELLREPRAATDAVHAYVIGLLAASVAAAALLLSPWGSVVSAPVVAVPLLVALRRRARLRRVYGPAFRPAAWSAPAALALGLALGVLYHGPTSDLDSRAYGDMLWYVHKAVSASVSLLPYQDLLVEGERIIYAEASPSVVAAALTETLRADVFLVHVTTLPVFALVSLAAAVGLVARERSEAPVLSSALLLAGAFVYPTWLVESPPVAMALPLAPAVYALWRRPAVGPWLFGLGGALVAGFLLTKVVGLAPVGILGLAVLVGQYRSGAISRRAGALIALGAVVLCVGALAFLVATAHWYAGLFEPAFLPADALRGLADQLDARDTQGVAPAFEVLGHALAVAALVRARAYVPALAAAVSVAGVWLLGGQGFDMAVGVALVVAALGAWDDPARFERSRGLLLAAGGSLVAAAVLRDISGVRAALLLVACLVAGCFALWAAIGGRSLRRNAVLAYAGAAAVAAVALVGPARPQLGSDFVGLTPEDRELWSQVSRATPPASLIFTSETGREVTGRQGWNNYPAVGRRQLYIAGWYDGALTADREEVDRRLALNARVLAGRLHPSDLDLRRRYGAAYAVLRAGEQPPASFAELWRNERFALYQIP